MIIGNTIDLHKIKRVMEDLMLDRYQHPDRGLGDAFYHSERTAKLSIHLREKIFPNDNSHDDILRVAAWFHDIAKGMPEHARFGAVMAREALKDFCTSDDLDEIYEIIRLHDDRGHSEYNNWVKLQQDADFIDHYGTYNIWFNFAYRAWEHKGDIADIAREQLEVYNDNTKKLNLLNFDFSKEIYKKRCKFQDAFWERLKSEANGEL